MKMNIIGIPYESKERWLQMKAIYDSCESADIEIPEQVQEFFADGTDEPEDEFPEIDLETFNDLDEGAIITNLDGFTVDLDKINNYNENNNPEIRFIRFKVEV